MFLIGIIFQEDFIALKLVSAFFLSLFIFYGLGKIILNKFKIEDNNNYFAPFIGFVSYQILTFFCYAIIIILNYNLNYISYFTDIIDIFLIIYILISYRIWGFKNFKLNYYSLLNFAFIFATSVIFIYLFTICENNLNWFNDYSSDLNYLTLNNIYLNDANTELFKPFNNDLDYYTIFQSNYYWLLVTTNSLNIDFELIVKYFVPALYFIIILFLLKGFILEKNNWKSNLLFLLFGTALLFVFGYQNVISEKFYGFYYLFAIIIIFLRYADNYYKDNSYIYFIIFITLLFYSFTYYSLIFTITIGFSIVFYLIYQKENIFTTIYYFLLILFIEGSFYFYAINIFYLIIFVAFSGLVVFLPLTFIYLSKNQKQIYKFEILVKENQKNITFILLMGIGLLFIIAFSLSIDDYFTILNSIFNNSIFWKENIFHVIYFSIPFYIILTTINLFIFLRFYFQKKEQRYQKFNNYFLFFALFFLLLFNMFSLPIWLIFFNLPILQIDIILLVYLFAFLLFFAKFLTNYNFRQNDRISTYIKI
ncbi:MAG: hypothetical protein HPPSJP_5090 [Candidatus Hepatoplasma scabrum]|nr:MAG: hypothetical protein HPPSJP_5090 [Candidatus Hepatoplasma sp.]